MLKRSCLMFALAASIFAVAWTSEQTAFSAATPGQTAAPSTKPAAVTVTFTDKTLPSSPGYHTLKGTAHVKGKDIPIATGLFLPPDYFLSKEPFPIVMTLHNRGHSGGDGTPGLHFEGLGLLLASDKPDTRGTGDKPKDPINLRKDAQFIGLVPQCPEGYGFESPPVGEIESALISEIEKKYRVDDDRIYLTGFSYGGTSVWKLALQVPHQFAAIAPLDGRASADPAHDVQTLKDVAIYLSVGGADSGFIPEAERMRDALIAAKHHPLIYRVVPNGNHWNYASVYTDRDFWEWMFTQRRSAHGSAASSTKPLFASSQPSTTSTSASATAPAAAETQVSAAATPRQSILCQYSRDIPGARIKDLTDDPAFPRFPSEQVYLNQFEIPPNQESGYGTVLRAMLHPPITGDYTFYIASDNQGELWLSSDEKPSNIQKIAFEEDWTLPRNWQHDANQQSKPIHLEAGKAYYIEARHKSGGGDNHLSVAWKLPDGKIQGPIPASQFSALPPSEIAPPKTLSITTSDFPVRPGIYRIKMDLEFRGHRLALPVLLSLPHDYSPVTPHPTIIFCPDLDGPADAEGFRIQGPAKYLSDNSDLARGSQFIVISPQCPRGQSWDKSLIQHCAAAAIDKLLHDLAADPQRIYLTGSGGGATFDWKLAELLPRRFTVVAPFCGLFVGDAQLPDCLEGTEVHIITGVLNGTATDCANRMKDSLAAIHPAPDVAYEMKMGSEVADAWSAKKDFYEWLLAWHRPPGQPATR